MSISPVRSSLSKFVSTKFRAKRIGRRLDGNRREYAGRGKLSGSRDIWRGGGDSWDLRYRKQLLHTSVLSIEPRYMGGDGG
jgi:hypothetical protein